MFDENTVARQIASGHKTGRKTFAFDENHDPTEPITMWFQDTGEGLGLFVIFYTQACRWSRCLGCNLPSLCSQFPVGFKNVLTQVDRVFANPAVQKRRSEIRRLIVSNNGSVLDQITFPSTALMHLVLQAQLNFSNLSVLCLETRAEYVEPAELEFLARAIKEGETPTELELAIGFEAFDDKIRNNLMKKGLTKKVFEELIGDMAEHRFRLKCYLMQKPMPGMTDEEGIRDIQNAIAYFGTLSAAHGGKDAGPRVQINVHLNPTYVAKGTILEKAFLEGGYTPPNLRDVARAALFAENLPLTVFIGLNDEGLAVPGGSFIREGDDPLVERLEKFNQRQDYNILHSFVSL
ncbi:MAG: hypothetical protein HYW90_02205 [Candidatus Sungbacteria bacterium]|nr:hypothetical protein [Candidatus Sungbacteria bacterium]